MPFLGKDLVRGLDCRVRLDVRALSKELEEEWPEPGKSGLFGRLSIGNNALGVLIVSAILSAVVTFSNAAFFSARVPNALYSGSMIICLIV
jgi:hypothetical protein